MTEYRKVETSQNMLRMYVMRRGPMLDDPHGCWAGTFTPEICCSPWYGLRFLGNILELLWHQRLYLSLVFVLIPRFISTFSIHVHESLDLNYTLRFTPQKQKVWSRWSPGMLGWVYYVPEMLCVVYDNRYDLAVLRVRRERFASITFH